VRTPPPATGVLVRFTEMAAAATIRSRADSGWETIATWLLAISTVSAPTTARGLEFALAHYGLLDRTHKGRAEDETAPLWVRRHDESGAA
jgi:predicted dithiol-disulfide oxidoreductase (DUF899 family)